MATAQEQLRNSRHCSNLNGGIHSGCELLCTFFSLFQPDRPAMPATELEVVHFCQQQCGLLEKGHYQCHKIGRQTYRLILGVLVVLVLLARPANCPIDAVHKHERRHKGTANKKKQSNKSLLVINQ